MANLPSEDMPRVPVHSNPMLLPLQRLSRGEGCYAANPFLFSVMRLVIFIKFSVSAKLITVPSRFTSDRITLTFLGAEFLVLTSMSLKFMSLMSPQEQDSL